MRLMTSTHVKAVRIYLFRNYQRSREKLYGYDRHPVKCNYCEHEAYQYLQIVIPRVNQSFRHVWLMGCRSGGL
jgi:hypothetical protein